MTPDKSRQVILTGRGSAEDLARNRTARLKQCFLNSVEFIAMNPDPQKMEIFGPPKQRPKPDKKRTRSKALPCFLTFTARRALDCGRTCARRTTSSRTSFCGYARTPGRRRVFVLKFERAPMTTAHRATWKAAQGGEREDGSFSLHAPSSAVAVRDLSGHGELKARHDEASVGEKREYSRELIEARERKASAAKRARRTGSGVPTLPKLVLSGTEERATDTAQMLQDVNIYEEKDRDVDIAGDEVGRMAEEGGDDSDAELKGSNAERGDAALVNGTSNSRQESKNRPIQRFPEKNAVRSSRDVENYGNAVVSGDETRGTPNLGNERGELLAHGRAGMEGSRSHDTDRKQIESASEHSSSADELDSDEEDDEEELRAALARIRRERAATASVAAAAESRKEVMSEQDTVRGTEGVVSAVRRRWDDDVIFRHQANTDRTPAPAFLNDTTHNDFHQRFMKRYIR